MTSKLVPKYTGPPLPYETTMLIQQWQKYGHIATTADRGTQTIVFKAGTIRRGYINKETLSRKAVCGYEFTSWPDSQSGECPRELVPTMESEFCKRYNCESLDIKRHDGGGSNKGRTFLLIMNRKVALRVMLEDAEVDEN